MRSLKLHYKRRGASSLTDWYLVKTKCTLRTVIMVSKSKEKEKQKGCGSRLSCSSNMKLMLLLNDDAIIIKHEGDAMMLLG